MKNPEDIRLASAAITLWILRFTQNDGPHFSIYSIFANGLTGKRLATIF